MEFLVSMVMTERLSMESSLPPVRAPVRAPIIPEIDSNNWIQNPMCCGVYTLVIASGSAILIAYTCGQGLVTRLVWSFSPVAR